MESVNGHYVLSAGLPRIDIDNFCNMLSRDKLGWAVGKVDPEEMIKCCYAPTFKGYLRWRDKTSKGRIKKESTILTDWKVLSMLYCDIATEWTPGKLLLDIDIGNVSVGSAPFTRLLTRLINYSGFLLN